jgi:hypothetical protein
MTVTHRKSLIAIAGAVALGVLATGSAALAHDSGENNMGGFVVPGSLDGVNPVYHPSIFGNPAVAWSYGFYHSRNGSWHVDPNWRWGPRRY